MRSVILKLPVPACVRRLYELAVVRLAVRDGLSVQGFGQIELRS